MLSRKLTIFNFLFYLYILSSAITKYNKTQHIIYKTCHFTGVRKTPSAFKTQTVLGTAFLMLSTASQVLATYWLSLFRASQVLATAC